MIEIIFFIAFAILLISFFRLRKKKNDLKKQNQAKEITAEERLAQEERGKKHELKRKNFIQNSKKYFHFLIEEFGYSDPEHKFNQQENGTIISDKLIYMNNKLDRMIVIANSYHSHDYGFDVEFYRPSISTSYSDDINNQIIVFNMDKEMQDIEQTYIEKFAKDIKENYLLQIKGEKWLDD